MGVIVLSAGMLLLCEPEIEPGQEKPSGLAALPERWVPMGVHRCYVSSPGGGDAGVLARTPESVELRVGRACPPQFSCFDRRDGHVTIHVKACGGGQCVALEGALTWDVDRVHFLDESRGYALDLFRSLDGTIVAEIGAVYGSRRMYHLMF